MSNNLALISAAKEVSNTVSLLVSTYHQIRSVRKCDITILKENIQIFQATCRSKGMGELIRTNIEEISKTQALIDSQSLSPFALEMAISQMGQLNKMLNKNMEEYMNGY